MKTRLMAMMAAGVMMLCGCGVGVGDVDVHSGMFNPLYPDNIVITQSVLIAVWEGK